MEQLVLSVRMRGDTEGPQTGDVVLSPARLASFEPNIEYEKDDIVLQGGHFYQAKYAFVSGDTFDPADWSLIGTGNLVFNNFQTNHAYLMNEPCVHNGSLYRAKTDFTSTDTFLPSDWEQISGGGGTGDCLWEHGSGSYGIQVKGTGTSSEGDYSVAEGKNTLARGGSSHVEGDGTLAKNYAEHAEGTYNKSNASSSSVTKDGTLHSIGIGTSAADRKNALEVMQNGDTYIINIGDYDGTNFTDANTIQDVIGTVVNKTDRFFSGEASIIIEPII